jgi:Secretion system C-terminal sorting domain
VLQTKINTKELNVSSVDSGTYIIKITENGNSTTRKLIVE